MQKPLHFHGEALFFDWSFGMSRAVARLRRLTAAMTGLIIFNQAGLWPADFSVIG
jgi:hypothetical protein